MRKKKREQREKDDAESTDDMEGQLTLRYDLCADAIVAQYIYNAWGQLLYSSGYMAAVNPLRYRGYYFDSLLGMYYLQSRYYDPVVGRFINADSYMSTGTCLLGLNMFASCNNNPVNLFDPDGRRPVCTLTMPGASWGISRVPLTAPGTGAPPLGWWQAPTFQAQLEATGIEVRAHDRARLHASGEWSLTVSPWCPVNARAIEIIDAGLLLNPLPSSLVIGDVLTVVDAFSTILGGVGAAVKGTAITIGGVGLCALPFPGARIPGVLTIIVGVSYATYGVVKIYAGVRKLFGD